MASKKNGEDKIIAGGSATGGGINFQAAVTALVEVHIAVGKKLDWLPGTVNDIPVNVSAETGGPGDDIGIQFVDGTRCEIQVKRSFTAGKKLWEAIMKLSKALNDNVVDYGVLVVCPNSSGTIKNEFARDLQRIAEGRLDGLKPIANEFIKKLNAEGFSVIKVAKSLRIITLSCLVSDSDAIKAAKAWLSNICSIEDTDRAWNSLYLDGGRLIEFRGARAADSIAQLLRSEGITLKGSNPTPSTILDSLCSWKIKTTEFFTIPGIVQPVSITKGWLELDALLLSKGIESPSGLAEALDDYHAKTQNDHRHSDDLIPTRSLGRFVRRCVLVGGPGMGKSTALKKLAHDYSLDGLPVIHFSAKSVAQRMRSTGCNFEEGVIALGLDGCGISISPEMLRNGIQWVVLCDALDEAINDQEVICESLIKFASVYPQTRIIVTTRPIGYSSSLLRAWRHYEIRPLKDSEIMKHVEGILRVITPDIRKQDEIVSFARNQIGHNQNVKIASRSPLILALVAALAEKQVALGDTKTQLYERLFHQMEQTKFNVTDSDLSHVILTKFLDILAWQILLNPTVTLPELNTKCGAYLATALSEPLLKACLLAEKCLKHWEHAGMVERVNHAGTEAITFIHKTFGEYASARYLSNMDEQSAHKEVQENIDNKNWSEVLIFASSLGLADTVLQSYLDAHPNLTYTQVEQALSIIIDSEVAPSLSIREQVYLAANIYLRSPIAKEAILIGNKLIGLGAKFPQEVTDLGLPLLVSEQPWTRLAGLAAVTFSSYLNDSASLKNLALEIPELSKSIPRKSRYGGFMLTANPHEQIDTVCIYIIKEILNHFSSKEADDLLLPLITWCAKTGTIGGVQNLITIMNNYGKENFVEVLGKPFSSRFDNLVFPPELPSEIESFVNALAILYPYSELVSPLKEGDKLWSFNGLIKATSILKQPINEVWTVQSSSMNHGIAEVLRCILIASSLDQLQLSIDVARLQKTIANIENKDASTVYQYIQYVDVEVDWQHTKGKVDLVMLEAALYDSTPWIVEASANMIAISCASEDLRSLVMRVLASGEDYALWAVSELCLLLDEPYKSELILSGLKKPLKSGSKYLYEALAKLDLALNEPLLQAIEAGLLTYGPVTAIAATAVAGKYVLDSVEVADLLQKGFELWCSKEQPYPIKGGLIPDSPRADILELLAKRNDFVNSKLLKYINDVRSDVSEIASEKLFRVLKTGELCDELLAGVSSKEISPKFLHLALSKKIIFTKPQIDSIVLFLSNPEIELRQMAILVLENNYLRALEINKYATQLLNDDDPEIRERARRLLVLTQSELTLLTSDQQLH